MTFSELCALLVELELRQTQLAKLIGVTARAVNMWCTGLRKVPGPVVAYLRIFARLTITQRHYEMKNSKIAFRGAKK